MSVLPQQHQIILVRMCCRHQDGGSQRELSSNASVHCNSQGRLLGDLTVWSYCQIITGGHRLCFNLDQSFRHEDDTDFAVMTRQSVVNTRRL